MSKMKIIVFSAIILMARFGWACSPVEPSVIPPATLYGEFEYIYPPSYKEQFLALLGVSKDVAVFKANFVWGTEESAREYAEIELLHGWGSQRGRLKKLHRENYFCGEFVNLKVGPWYVGILENGVPTKILEYNLAKTVLSKRGDPEYVFTAVGLLR